MSATQLDRLVTGLRKSLEPAGPTDRELLDRFVAGRDADAFETLVRRHGPAVLAACRGVLRNGPDADDAFQATFLALAEGARRVRTAAVGGWLVVVAHRVSARLLSASRRRAEVEARHERSEADAPDQSWRETCDLLHAELDALALRYRLPLVLCYLRGLSRDEAARRLGWPVGVLKGRLERGRSRLRARLAKRGLTLSAGLLAAVATPAAVAVPARLVRAVADRGAVSPAAAALVRALRPVSGPAWKALGLLGLAAGLVIAVTAGQPAEPASAGQATAKAPPAAKAEPAVPQPVAVRGRVLGPDGKALAGAKLWVVADGCRAPAPQETTAADGAFAFTLPAAPGFKYRYVLATAPDVGCDWAVVPPFRSPGELTLRLPEEVPITGRLLDLEGRPVAGAAVRLEAIGAPTSGSLDEFLAQYPGRQHEASINLLDKRLLEGRPLAELFHATTDAAGRFTIRGIGKDRVPGFIVSSKGHAQQAIRVVTRAGYREAYDPTKHRFRVTGPDFTLALPPTRPISGSVRDAATKKPVAGARVSYLFDGQGAFLRHWHAVETTTDGDGRYTLLGAPAGPPPAVRVDGDLTVSDAVILVDTPPDRGYLHHYVRVGGDRFGPATADVDLQPGVIVEGRLTDRDTGTPVRAHVWYRPLQENDREGKTPGYAWLPFGPWAEDDTTRTDADGRFKLTALPGPGLIHIQTWDLNPTTYPAVRLDPKDKGRVYHAPFTTMPDHVVFKTGGRGGHYGPESLNAYVVIDPKPGDTTVRVDHTLWAGHTRTLKIVDPDGKPVTGAEGTLSPVDGMTPVGGRPVATGLDPERPRRLMFRQADRRLFALIELRGTEPEPVEVRLQPTATITGRVVDTEGRGMPDIAVEPSFQDHPLGTLLNTERLFARPGRAVKTDAGGRFTFAGIPPGIKLSLIATRGRDDYWYSKDMMLKPGQVLDLGDWRRE